MTLQTIVNYLLYPMHSFVLPETEAWHRTITLVMHIHVRTTHSWIDKVQLNILSEGVELKFIDLQLGCAYMYVYSRRGRTLSGRSSLEIMEDMTHLQGVVSRSAHPSKTCKSWQRDQEISAS